MFPAGTTNFYFKILRHDKHRATGKVPINGNMTFCSETLTTSLSAPMAFDRLNALATMEKKLPREESFFKM